MYDNGIVALLVPAALTTAIAYVSYTFIYNIFFHPLAKFPGPLAARATFYWKAYVECIEQRSFCHVLAELHAQYGEMLYARDTEYALTRTVPTRRCCPCRTQ
jgi:hypothetical protein